MLDEAKRLPSCQILLAEEEEYQNQVAAQGNEWKDISWQSKRNRSLRIWRQNKNKVKLRNFKITSEMFKN